MISIVIPIHNRKDLTRDCLCSLRKQSHPPERIIVVDDGSTDGTAEMLRSEFPDVIVLHGDGNLFWTAAINLGIKHALRFDPEYILTLNNDTVASGDFIEKMLAGAKGQHALLGALEMDAVTGKPYYGGEIFDWKWWKSTFLLDILTQEQQKGLHEVSLYPGRGLLIPRAVFERVGFFEERKLPHYLADYDFTLMAKRKGFKVYCNYEAKLYTYPDECGNHKIRKTKTVKNYLRHLFDIKGGGNLSDFTVYTLRNCPPQNILPAFITGFIRRLGGFWLK